MMNLFLEVGPYIVLPVLALHMVLDLYDKHRHGIKIHDAVGVLTYAVLALHFAFDLERFF